MRPLSIRVGFPSHREAIIRPGPPLSNLLPESFSPPRLRTGPAAAPRTRGYTNVRGIRGGLKAWKAAALPVQKAAK